MEGFDNTHIKTQLLQTLVRRPKLSAKELSEELGLSKPLINSTLYKENCFRSEGNKPPRWSIIPISIPMTENKTYIQPENGEGIPGYLGYKVGANGKMPTQRRNILNRIMTRTLPDFISAEHMKEWGDIQSQSRLNRLAGHIAYFHNTHKSSSFKEARRDWKNDFTYLKEKYWDVESRGFQRLMSERSGYS